MPSFWQGLLASLAIVAAVVSIWTNARDYLPTLTHRWQSLMFGAVMGVGAVLSMLMPFKVAPGLMVDMRSALLASAGFFGGPLAGLAAAGEGLICRGMLGGFGVWAGCLGIALTTTVGVAGHRLVGGRPTRERDIVLLALATASGNVLSFLVLPSSAWNVLLPQALGQATVLVFFTTLLAGLAILQDNRRRDLTRSNMVYRAIIQALPDCLNAKDLEGRFLAANPATARLMRAPSADDLIGKTDFDFYQPEIARQFLADETAAIEGGAPRTIEQFAAFEDGTTAWLSTLKAPIRDDLGRLIGLITHNRDVTAQKRLQEELKTARQRLEDALEYMADGLVLYGRDGVILLCNPQYRRLFPMTSDVRVPGAAVSDVLRASITRGEYVAPETVDVEAWIAERREAVLSVGDRVIQLAGNRWLEARTRLVSGGGWLVILSDITDRKRTEDALALANKQLAELALTDGLTGLTNRRGFDQALDKEFARSARDQSPLSLMLIDVDKFKAFNDTYGHQIGDECLRLISKELRRVVRRAADLVARYGGEELVAILPNTPAEGAGDLAEAFRVAIRGLGLPHVGSEFGVVTVSIGVSTDIPGQGIKRPRDLVGKADEALYVAKRDGRDRVCIAAGCFRSSSDRLAAAS